VLIDWSKQFDGWLDDLEAKAATGDPQASTTLDLIAFQLKVLQDLPGQPAEESPRLKRVRQSGRHEVWRVSHPYREGFAVRTIVWFPSQNTAVIALFANDKARMGDVFYSSVGSRADQIIDQWIRDNAPRPESNAEQENDHD
jgi:hypothetical protein